MGVLENKRRARFFYKYLSQVYDEINPYIWNEEMRDTAMSMIDIQQDDMVLDVGCGTGFATEALIERSDNVYGLDQSAHQLENAWKKLGKHDPVTFTFGDAERLPFASNTFDVVWSSGSIEYWPNPVLALREFNRVLKPGGEVLVVGPNNPETTVMEKLADAIMLFYGKDEADRMFTEAGFTHIDHTLMGPEYKPEVAIVTTAQAPDFETS